MNQPQQPDLYRPGTQLTVGSHKVVINKYFSHGGFAQVYTCTISPPWNNKQVACLKRVNVPDKGSLNTLRKEVDAMRKLQGINCIVSYIDSHAARSTGGKPGYEVFVLMEYCSRKGLIDFMNTRLVNKLTEPEILVIMQQITEAVAHMHALNPPLIHRDIKIENVLLGDDGTYKLCDFGSVSEVIHPPSNVEEFQIIQDDIMKNTTPQYRCPEMLDLYRRQPIDEKSDVWALGVFLYKLCYYTTPFEQNAINGNVNGYGGDYAIINGIYSFPSSPSYSARLKNIIAKLLTVDPKLRPNVFQLLDEVCKLRGVSCPVIKKASTPLQYNPIAMQAGASSSVASFNNSMNNAISRSKNIPASVTGVNNSLSGRAEGSTFKYNNLKDAINSNITRNGIDGLSGGTPKELVPPKVRSRRPLSLYGNSSLNRKGSRESLDIQNFMSELSNEEVVNLSPPAKGESIASSVDYLKSVSRQNTNSSHYNGSSSRHPSRSKKRSSITSIKNLLTGGSTKSQHTSTAPATQPSRSSSMRKSSTYSQKRNSSVESLTDGHQKFRNMNSSLSDLQEMSPESKTAQKFTKSPVKVSIDNTPSLASPSKSLSSSQNGGTQRSSNIQSRVKNLFRSTSPPPVKTAQGYGKYTESSKRDSVKTTVTASSELIMPKESLPSSNIPRHAKSLGTIYNSDKGAIPSYTSTSRRQGDKSNYKTSTVSGKPTGDVASSILQGKRKPPPPPKPKKPEYLKSPGKLGGETFLDDDLEVLEKRFERKFPGVV